MSVAANVLSVSIENYLESIYNLSRNSDGARSKDIAELLGVTRASVTGMLQTLRDRGLINYEPYGTVTLTPDGETAARRVARRHEALRDFMVHVLAIDDEAADAAACHMEHGIPKQIVDRFAEFAEFVRTCPRVGSQWIEGVGYRCAVAATTPKACVECIEKCLTNFKSKTEGAETTMEALLSELKPGEKGHIERVAGQGAVKRRIRDMGVTTGSLVEVIRVAPLGDPIDVKIKGYHLSLRKAEAADICVKRLVDQGAK